jgi:hypothetical protein
MTSDGKLMTDSKRDIDAHLERLLAECTIDLFASYGVELQRVRGTPVCEGAFAASIGVAGEKLRGSLVLLSPIEIIRLSHPTVGAEAEADFAIIADWGAELANQLAGRVKNQLLAWGIELQLSTPIAFAKASLIDLPFPLVNTVIPIAMRSKVGRLSTWFAAEISPDLVLSNVPPSAEAPAMHEGTLTLF